MARYIDRIAALIANRKAPLMHGTLSLSDAIALGAVCDAAIRCAPVARATDGGDVVYGLARSVGGAGEAFLPAGEDVRAGYLRVTTRTGYETFWLVSELVSEYHAGLFVLDYTP